MTNEKLERQIMDLIATDRIFIPIKSMAGKLERRRPKIAEAMDMRDGSYVGDRAYARISLETGSKARGMADSIELFAEQYPRHGAILKGLIAEERVLREPHLYFGMNPGSRLTSDDYMGVMTSMGFTEATAERLYPELMEVSRNLSRQKKRADEERSILIG